MVFYCYIFLLVGAFSSSLALWLRLRHLGGGGLSYDRESRVRSGSERREAGTGSRSLTRYYGYYGYGSGYLSESSSGFGIGSTIDMHLGMDMLLKL